MNEKSRLMTLQEVMYETKMGKSKLYKLVKEKRFPRQRKHGDGSVVWVRTEIESWVNSLIKEEIFDVNSNGRMHGILGV